MKKAIQILTAVTLVFAMLGGLYAYDQRKVDKAIYTEFAASVNVQFLEQHRRYIQARIWELQARHPDTYHQIREYQRLVEELRQIDMKIRAFYQRRGG